MIQLAPARPPTSPAVKTLVKKVLSGMIEVWGHDPEIYPIEQGDGTQGDQFGIYADIRRLTEELDWKPEVQVPEVLKRMADWAKWIPTSRNRLGRIASFIRARPLAGN